MQYSFFAVVLGQLPRFAVQCGSLRKEDDKDLVQLSNEQEAMEFPQLCLVMTHGMQVKTSTPS